ncbi:MAG: hypothetical protein AUG14_05085 [Candidatus Rokubacteria bacterium 13_1_20CM_2_68_19]|nr:MAG: hypothetical protein AUH18_09425 [Candidatus Rokubacteria bacterium 13_2_20CM_69_10]OLB39847.1 MAG: hypothetical protein AUI04_11295 [Candidatus Rokubacteria bacterium 13_2_20CM_2_64_8]OLC61360.1 MAG: hypothetical protein AUH76_10105 [Candidatus Rokubacteria bacterium 13_1_40CM_4_67_11]OLD32865.1 MAG: hypothetical protein AUI49_01765 [Candidatus Rokubacteria bacterium 13_1_40CM_2_68_13]OLD97707.1 MAG: hypothetical protein AUG80_10250 [Candidatus Rokubacteria bacterium 13_1_20CM_4_68_9]
MGVMSAVDLIEAWSDLLRRRPTFAPALAVYEELVRLWAATPVEVTPLDWDSGACAHRWERGVPILAEATPPLDAETVEPLLGPVLDIVGGLRGDAFDGLRAFADAWDAGHLTVTSLFPARGRLGTVDHRIGLDAALVAFISAATLRPLLEQYFLVAREHLADGVWQLGVCPFCGAPPGFSDVVEDGRRRLACHVCGGSWTASRVWCSFCGNTDTEDLRRLEPESGDEGYFISACIKCRGYLKELDRRVRWNGGPALVEDWGSPHLDLVAQRSGYWRALPTIVDLGKKGNS